MENTTSYFNDYTLAAPVHHIDSSGFSLDVFFDFIYDVFDLVIINPNTTNTSLLSSVVERVTSMLSRNMTRSPVQFW